MKNYSGLCFSKLLHYLGFFFSILWGVHQTTTSKALWLQSTNELQVLRFCDYSNFFRINKEPENLDPATVFFSWAYELFFKVDYAHIRTHTQKINNSGFAHALNQSSSVKRANKIEINISYK